MAMLRQPHGACVCSFSSSPASSSSTIACVSQTFGPRARTSVRIRHPKCVLSDRTAYGNSSCLPRPHPQQHRSRSRRTSQINLPLVSDEARRSGPREWRRRDRTKDGNSCGVPHQQRNQSWSSSDSYFQRTESSGVVRPVAKMNSSKDATLPISMPHPSSAVLKEEVKLKSSRMTRRGAMVASAYMVCAVMLVMFNKSALSTYKFPCANVITVLQMICSTALLYVLRKLDIITFTNEGNGILDPIGKGFVPMRTLKRAYPLSISYLFYMVVGMASIRGVNVPMYTTLRRTTVLFTMVLEFFLAGQRHSTPIVSSVGLIILGAFIAGARDLSFDSHGYFIVLLSNLTTAMYLTTISHLGKSTGLNSFGLMWCNGIICGPILLLWTIISGELGMALRFPAMFLPGFQLVILLSCMMAFCLNYTIFLNTSLNSPLTQTMCGNLKDLGTVLIGWVWFGGLPFDWVNVLGQLLGFLGSGLYAYCKLRGI